MLQILHKKHETNKNISRKCLNSNVGMAVVKNGQQQDTCILVNKAYFLHSHKAYIFSPCNQ